MARLRYDYAKDVDAATAAVARISSIDSRLPLTSVPVAPETISVDGSQWFHAVDAFADKSATGQPVIRVRVIIDSHRGVNVTIPRTELLYHKFRDLRFQIRNSDCVMVTFPELYVMGSAFRHELCLRAYDFKMQEPQSPKPTVYI